MRGRSLRLNIAPVAVGRVALACVAVVALTNTAADPDLWGHIRFGRDIVAGGAVARADPYSFTSDRPWINHEWLAEAIMYAAYSSAGPRGLLVLKLTLLLATLWTVWIALARSGIDPPMRRLLVALTVIGMMSRAPSVRPQLFSMLLFAVLLLIVAEIERGRLRAAVAIPIVMAIWVNLHGGWVVGAGTLMLWAVLTACDRARPWGRRAWCVASAAAGVAATLASPYGIGLWQFAFQTIGLSRPDITEWHPMYRADVLVMVAWLLVVAPTVTALWRYRGRITRTAAAPVLALMIASLRVNRLDAFFTLAVVILLSPQLADLSATARSFASGRWLVGELPKGAALVHGVAIVLLVAFALGLTAPGLRCIKMNAAWLPEREAGRFLLQNRLQGRMVTSFNWGEYAIWHAGPDLLVSLDGRRETVYSEATLAQHAALYRGDPEALNLAEDLHADFAWLPSPMAATTWLASRGWHVAFRGNASTILSRRPVAIVAAAPFDNAERCFPGP